MTKEPAETEAEVKTYTCQTCGHQKTEIILFQPTTSGNDPDSSGNGEKPDSPDGDGNENNSDTPGGDGNEENTGSPNNPDSPGGDIDNTDDNISTDKPINAQHNETGSKTGNGGTTEPKTGNSEHLHIYATIAMAAGMSYLLLYFTDKDRGISIEEKDARISQMINWAKKGGSFRKIIALIAIFVFLTYYHSIGKRKETTKWI